MITRLAHSVCNKLGRVFYFVRRQRAALLRLLVAFGLIGYFSAASAGAATGLTLGSIAGNIQTTIKYYSIILGDVALIAGISFVLMSLFKFHQHKQNPTQVKISQGVALLIIGAALLIFPYILTTAKRAVFGSATVATLSGSAIGGIVGGSLTG